MCAFLFPVDVQCDMNFFPLGSHGEGYLENIGNAKYITLTNFVPNLSTEHRNVANCPRLYVTLVGVGRNLGICVDMMLGIITPITEIGIEY